MTLEEAIEYTERAYKESRNGLQYALKRRETRFAERCKKDMEEYEQLAEWLRELQERRKVPEIIRCTECKNKSFCPSKIDCGDGLYWYVRFCSRGEQDEKRTDEVHTVENCCKNCEYSGNYDGWNEFICKYYNGMIRGEQYDCEGFKPEREN